MDITSILAKAEAGTLLDKEDAVALLQTENTSSSFYQLLAAANGRSRRVFGNRGYIFAQIGLNAYPCSGNCSFCSLAEKHFVVGENYEKSCDEVVAQVQEMETGSIDALFLMTTADYPQERFLEIGKAVRQVLDRRVHLVANIGDFDGTRAHQLKEAGFDGAYHIVRLREGTDTRIPRETRIATLDAIQEAGLELYYCVEPIGPEHTYEELADEMLRARDYKVNMMAVMGRVGVPGTRFADSGEITELELTKIAAVAGLVTAPGKSMNVHEPKKMALLAGVNQLYAEVGINPRDTSEKTEDNRGMGIRETVKYLEEAEYRVERRS